MRKLKFHIFSASNCYILVKFVYNIQQKMGLENNDNELPDCFSLKCCNVFLYLLKNKEMGLENQEVELPDFCWLDMLQSC